MLVKLKDRQAALAAEKYYLVHNFLELRNLDCEKYYDAALDGFLSAVKAFDFNSPVSSFEELAIRKMNGNCVVAMSFQEKSDALFSSLEDCFENGLPIEKAVSDAIDIAKEVVDAISFEETLSSFSANERRIAELLLAGYTERSIADILDMNILSVFRNIESIYKKISQQKICLAA